MPRLYPPKAFGQDLATQGSVFSSHRGRRVNSGRAPTRFCFGRAWPDLQELCTAEGLVPGSRRERWCWVKTIFG